MNENFMKEKPVFPLLVSMALPMVISMLVNSLYNIVDSFFVAQISEDAMTALSLVYPVQNFVNAVAIGFGIGLNAVISYYLGAGDKKAAGCAATQGLALTMLHAVILTIGSLLVIERFLRMFSSSETVIDLGVRYSRIIFLFTIAIMANLYFEKVFQAVGRMKVTMTGMMIGCIVNIILDPLIIFGIGPFPRLGIEGAALATGIGQVTPVVIYWIIYKIRPISVKIRPEYFKRRKKSGRKTVRDRRPGDPEPGAAVSSDFRTEWNPGRVFPELRCRARHLLQAADVHLSDSKRHCTGHAPDYRLQLRRRRA